MDTKAIDLKKSNKLLGHTMIIKPEKLTGGSRVGSDVLITLYCLLCCASIDCS